MKIYIPLFLALGMSPAMGANLRHLNQYKAKTCVQRCNACKQAEGTSDYHAITINWDGQECSDFEDNNGDFDLNVCKRDACGDDFNNVHPNLYNCLYNGFFKDKGKCSKSDIGAELESNAKELVKACCCIELGLDSEHDWC